MAAIITVLRIFVGLSTSCTGNDSNVSSHCSVELERGEVGGGGGGGGGKSASCANVKGRECTDVGCDCCSNL